MNGWLPNKLIPYAKDFRQYLDDQMPEPKGSGIFLLLLFYSPCIPNGTSIRGRHSSMHSRNRVNSLSGAPVTSRMKFSALP